MKRGIIKLTLGGLIMAYILIAGCKNDNVLGPNMNNGVTFQISQRNGQNNGIEFLFKPSVDSKISRVVCRYPAQQFADTIVSNNANYVFSKDTTYIINEYINVTPGQQWMFDFSGNAPTGNTAYNVTSNYTVQ